MSLAIKKSAEAEQGRIEAAQKGISEVVGAPVTVEIDWNTFTTTQAADCIRANGVEVVWGDLKSLCSDKTGKDAVKAAVKKIRFVQDNTGKQNMQLKGGVLTLTTDWVNNYFSTFAVKEYLMANL